MNLAMSGSNPFPLTKVSGSLLPTPLAHYAWEASLLDSSGNGRTATAPNGLSYVTGYIGSAIRLNGTNQYTELPTLSAWDELNTKDLSAFSWYKSTDITANKQQVIGNFSTLTGISPTPNQFWDLSVDNTGKAFVSYRRDNNAENINAFSTSTDISDGTWHHLGFIKRGLDIEIWVDKVKENTATLSSDGSCANNQPVRMGVLFGRYLAADFDETYLYDLALSQAQVDELYAKT